MMYRKPTIVIPAAGRSQRFLDKGIRTPKPLIKFRYDGSPKRCMVEHALGEWDWLGLPVVVGCPTAYAADFQANLPKAWDFRAIESTVGQADTLMQTLKALPRSGPVLVVNSDVRINYPIGALLEQAGDNACTALTVPIDKSDPLYANYSTINNFPIFTYAAEKRVLSPLGLAGAYYFQNSDQLGEALASPIVKQESEVYLSQALGYLPGRKLAVMMPRDRLVGWNTPEELLGDPLVSDVEL